MSFSSRRNDWKGGLLPEFFLSAGCDQHSYAPAWLSRKTCRKFGEGPPNYDAKGRNNHQMPLRKWDLRLTISNHFKPFRTISNNLFFSMFFHILWLSQGWISPGLARRSRPGASLWACGPLGFSGSGPCGAVTSGGQQRRLRPALRQATGSVGSKWLKWGEVWFGVSYPLVI